jgi:hypothetical protein
MTGVIRLCNHRGDQTIVEYKTDDVKSVRVAQDKLSAFLDDCIQKYGAEPPVYAKRIGEDEFKPFLPKGRKLRNLVGDDDLSQVVDVVLRHPLVGG